MPFALFRIGRAGVGFHVRNADGATVCAQTGESHDSIGPVGRFYEGSTSHGLTSRRPDCNSLTALPESINTDTAMLEFL